MLDEKKSTFNWRQWNFAIGHIYIYIVKRWVQCMQEQTAYLLMDKEKRICKDNTDFGPNLKKWKEY